MQGTDYMQKAVCLSEVLNELTKNNLIRELSQCLDRLLQNYKSNNFALED